MLPNTYIYWIPKGQSKIDNPEKLAIKGTQDKEKQDTVCVGHHYAQTNTNYVSKTWALLQTTTGNDDPNIICYITTNPFFYLHLSLYIYIYIYIYLFIAHDTFLLL